MAAQTDIARLDSSELFAPDQQRFLEELHELFGGEDGVCSELGGGLPITPACPPAAPPTPAFPMGVDAAAPAPALAPMPVIDVQQAWLQGHALGITNASALASSNAPWGSHFLSSQFSMAGMSAGARLACMCTAAKTPRGRACMQTRQCMHVTWYMHAACMRALPGFAGPAGRSCSAALHAADS